MAMILLLDLDYFKQLGDSSGKLNFTSLKRNGRKILILQCYILVQTIKNLFVEIT